MGKFQYACPATVTEAVGLALQHPGYCWIAGGTDFMVKVRLKHIEPAMVIDVGRLKELRQLHLTDGILHVGAAVTHTELAASPLVEQYAPALQAAAGLVGSPQIRNRGTVGGNIGNASPAADTVPALLAYGAEAVIRGKTETRRVALADLFIGPGRTILEPGELIAELCFPAQQPGQGSSFEKLGKRKALAISVVNAAAWLELDGQKVRQVRLALGSVAAKPIRLTSVEDILKNEILTERLIQKAADMVSEVIRPIDDVRSEAGYRKQVAGVLIRRALENSWQQAARFYG